MCRRVTITLPDPDNRMMRMLFLLAACLLFVAPSAYAHGTLIDKADIDLKEKPGQFISGDAVFVDEAGRNVNLKNLIDRPTIIAPVYLKCMHECPLLLTGLARALGKTEMVRPGQDYRVIALSFDETDTPSLARRKKRDYLKAVGRPFPPDAWTFLTGSAADIKKFTDSIGFTFQRDGTEFSHPLTVIVLAPGGKITRYLYGMSFLPFSITMAVTEAAEGRIGSTAARVLNYCFSYDPLKKSYVFNVLKVVGTVMVLFAASFFIYLVFTTKRRSEK